MGDSLVKVYIHCVWGTWDRLPLINNDNEKQIYNSIMDKCKEHNCEVIALGGIADHVHILVRLAPTVTISSLIKEIKGATSHLVTHTVNPGEFFKWQGSYATFSVNEKDVPRVKAYILHQKEHHAENTQEASLELLSG